MCRAAAAPYFRHIDLAPRSRGRTKLNAMKKFLLLIGLAAMSMTATAQNESVWNVHAGWNLANMSVSNGDASMSFKSHSQFQVGFSYSLPLSQTMPLYLGAGVDFTGRGAEYGDEKANLYYLQIPVTVSWNFDLGRIVSIRPSVGIYYAAGLFSNVKEDGKTLKDQFDDNYDLFSKYTYNDESTTALKTSDFGLRFGVDVALKEHYSIGLGYDLGLMNINKDWMASDVKVKNGAFYIRVGYNF